MGYIAGVYLQPFNNQLNADLYPLVKNLIKSSLPGNIVLRSSNQVSAHPLSTFQLINLSTIGVVYKLTG